MDAAGARGSNDVTRIPPPADRALPGLGTLFDGEVMQAELGSRLRPDSGFELTECRPIYVRYKAGTNCIVQYRLRLESKRDGAALELPAHASIHADGAAETDWNRSSFQRLLDRARRSHGELPIPRGIFLEELPALVEVYPVDRKLRRLLRAASASEARAALRESLPDVDRAAFDVTEIERIRYKPRRKALLRYRLEGSTHSVVYGKLYARGVAERRFRIARLLSAAFLPTPPALAYDSELELVTHAEAEGTRLRDLRGGGDFKESMPLVAEALEELHSTAIDAIPELYGLDAAGSVMASGMAIGSLLPERAEQSLQLATRIAARIGQLDTRTSVLHGDFYDDQALVSPRGVTLLDFDEICIGPPAADVGNFIAHLEQNREDATALEGARAAFLEACVLERPDVAWSVALFESTALLRRAVAPFRQMRPDWPDRVAYIVELAARRFEEYERSSRRRSSGNGAQAVDPALPALVSLQDPETVARELERGVYGRPTELLELEIVRHKPGRRCTLRFRVRGNGGGAVWSETLYAKTYARGRAGRVHEVLRLVGGARVWGPGVAIPDAIAHLPALDASLQREVKGEPVADSLVAGDEGVAARIAEALHDLHRATLELPRRHSPEKEIEPLKERVERLAALCPSLGEPAQEALALVQERSWQAGLWRWRPVHRDFYYDQVLAGEHGLSLLDFDDAAMSEPAVDVANFLAHLGLLSLKSLGRPDGLAAVAEAFRQRSRELDEELDPRLVRFLEGATLLRLAQIHSEKENGPWLAARLLDESRRVLVAAS